MSNDNDNAAELRGLWLHFNETVEVPCERCKGAGIIKGYPITSLTMFSKTHDLPLPRGPVTQICGRHFNIPLIGANANQPDNSIASALVCQFSLFNIFGIIPDSVANSAASIGISIALL